jgi:hypothetical protein
MRFDFRPDLRLYCASNVLLVTGYLITVETNAENR